MTSRLDNLEEVSLAAPDTPLHNNDNPLWFAARETTTTPSHSSINTPGNHDTSPLLSLAQPDKGETDLFGEKICSPHSTKSANSKRPRVVLLLVSVILAIVAAVLLTVYFLVIKPHNDATQAQHASQPVSTGPTSTGSTGGSNGSTWGGNGSTVTTSDGSTFTYINPFGGYCKYCWRIAFPMSAADAFSLPQG